jgi:hypothetical protein
LAATEIFAAVDPALLAGDTVIQDVPLEVVHEHSAVPVTSTRVVVPAAGAVTASGATVKLHPPSWPSVNVCPPTATVPDRGGPGLAGTDS